MNFSKLITDSFRQIIWFLCQCTFPLMDGCYDVIQSLVTLNLDSFDFIWDWYSGLMVLISFFIITRLVINYCKSVMDDEILSKIDPLNLIIRVGAIALLIALLPSILKGFSGISSDMLANMSSFLGVDETVPSHIIAMGSNYGADVSTFNVSTLNINELVEGSKTVYKYFPNAYDIVFAFATSVVSCLLFVFIGIQVAQRLFGLLLKILISPYALSGLIDPEDKTFATWFKLCIADFLTAFFQMIFVVLVLTGVTAVTLDPLPKIIFFIGGLMAIMNAPSGIAQLLGGEVGVGTAFQQMQSMMMLGSAAKVAASGVNMAAQGAMNAGAGMTYGIGRIAGAPSMLNHVGRDSSSSSSSGSSPSVSSSSVASGSGGGSSGTSGGGSSGGGSSTSPSTYSSGGSSPNSNNNSNSPIRSIASSIGGHMYTRAASRLSRPKTDARGNIRRQSRPVQASHIAHNAVDLGRSIRQNGNVGGTSNDVH